MTHGRQAGTPDGEVFRDDARHDHGTAPDGDAHTGGDAHSGGTGGGERLSAELRALLEGLGSWAESPGNGARSGECGWCPLCALAELVRQRHPELLAQLAEAVRVLRTAVAEPVPEDPAATGAGEAAAHPADAGNPADSAGAEPTSKAERITVRRVDGPVTAVGGSEPGRENETRC